jgi:hypothetical protein
MLRKILILGLVPLGAAAIAPSVSASAPPVCPFYLGDSGMTDAQIIAFCDAWERERRLPPSKEIKGPPDFPGGWKEVN